ncbi:hypothetical protein PDJAM_G00159040 [Pangasius djambal]|uniref:Uncharacterized protein n=1 Tax=Pangasius djambal TaxID=1691987 RepID=A0ACC5ZIT3_9TELE|nr:hypothetical protein [Pangasius djambal]
MGLNHASSCQRDTGALKKQFRIFFWSCASFSKDFWSLSLALGRRGASAEGLRQKDSGRPVTKDEFSFFFPPG